MGLLRRIFGALTGNSKTRAEDIVFEPIAGPQSTAVVRTQSTEEPVRGAVQRVALGDLMVRVPEEWRRSGEFAPEQMIELPPSAQINAGAERPLAFSLRYLVRSHPALFRDPGSAWKDVGVDLAMEPLREPEPVLGELPAEVIQEAQAELETFAEWEGETQSKRARSKEARETEKALKAVQLPASLGPSNLGFDSILEESGEEPAVPSPVAENVHLLPRPPQVNTRLRRILEAYAEGIPSDKRPLVAADPARTQKPVDTGIVELAAKTREAVTAVRAESPVAVPAFTVFSNKPAASTSPLVSQITDASALAEPPAMQQTRFEELGLSLSRFPEVRGFALWLGEHAMQTGDLGVDTQAATTRFRLEKILESASLTQGAQDGFLSITVHHARGGISIFGGGSCLVAVSHQNEGMPSHLRSWLCGWVSQPLRG
jgi:hypothetical protein